MSANLLEVTIKSAAIRARRELFAPASPEQAGPACLQIGSGHGDCAP
jgi:hypothetical protein